MHKLVLIRHGESIWDVEDRFVGWTDVHRNRNGMEQANRAGRLLKAGDRTWLPVLNGACLNGCHVCALQGNHKADVSKQRGDTNARARCRRFDRQALAVRMHKRRLVVAHVDSIRARVEHLDKIPDNAIVRINVPNGMPLVVELDDSLKQILHYHLGFTDAATETAAAVAMHVNALDFALAGTLAMLRGRNTSHQLAHKLWKHHGS